MSEWINDALEDRRVSIFLVFCLMVFLGILVVEIFKSDEAGSRAITHRQKTQVRNISTFILPLSSAYNVINEKLKC